MPVIAPPRLRGYGPGLSHTLQQALAESSPTINAIPSHETLSRLNRKGVAEGYIQMVKDWDYAGILERGRLQSIGAALGVRLVLLPGMAEYFSYLEERFTLEGLHVLQTRTVRLRLSLQLWNAETGELLWESFGGGGMQREVVSERQGLMTALAQKIWEGMIEDLQKGKTKSFYFGVDTPDNLLEGHDSRSPGASDEHGQ
jgi:hypothetical protein